MNGVQTLPQLRLVLDGAVMPAVDLQSLSGVIVRQRLSMPALCELTFSEPPSPRTISSSLRPGTNLRLNTVGFQVPLFVGQVTAVERAYGPAKQHEVRIRAYDNLHRLRKRQPMRVHLRVTPADLAWELVTDLGLRVQAVESGPSWSMLFQHQQSDLELLVDLAERCGMYLTVREDVLHLLRLAGDGDSVALALGENLLEAQIEVNGDPASRSVGATGWNTSRVEIHEGEANDTWVGRSVAAEVPPGQVNGSGRRDLVDTRTAGEGQAAALAQADLDRQMAREVTFQGAASGDPQLRPGIPVELSGVDDSLNGRFVLTEVTHSIDARLGFVSQLSTHPPAARPRQVGAVTSLGVVTQIDDPDNAGRVKTRLPSFGDVETDWLPVVTAGAGQGKGLVALPDIDDLVLLLLAHGDPARSIVLGGLYGMDGPPDSGVKGGAVARYTFRTPQGQQVQLDDVEKTIRLENSDGSFVILSPDLVHIHAATDLLIEAPGRSIVVRGQEIDFQQG